MASAKVIPVEPRKSTVNLADGVGKEELEFVKKVAKDQDTSQKLNAFISITIELYRVMVSSLLIVFVPQQCGDTNSEHLCTMSENMQSDGWLLYDAALAINFITLGVFSIMYFLEARREGYLIKHFDVNPKLPTDSDSIGELIDKVPQKQRDKLYRIVSQYRGFVYLALGTFSLNAVLSCIILSYYQLGSQTFSVYATNILFMATKLNDIHKIGSADKNIFLSAYIRIKLQYNALDPDKFGPPIPDSDMGSGVYPQSHTSDYEMAYDDKIAPINNEGVTADGGPIGGGRKIIKRENPQYTTVG